MKSPLKSLMAKKQTKPVEQPTSEEVDQVWTDEEASGGEQEYFVRTPSVQETETEKIASVANSKKKKAQSSSSVVPSRKMKKKKKRPIEEGSSRDVNAKLLKTEEKQTKKKPVEQPPSQEGEEFSMEKEEEEEDIKNVVLIKERENWFEKPFLVELLGSVGLDEEMVREGWVLVPAENKKIIQEMLKELEIGENRCMLRQMGIVSKVASAIAEATS